MFKAKSTYFRCPFKSPSFLVLNFTFVQICLILSLTMLPLTTLLCFHLQQKLASGFTRRPRSRCIVQPAQTNTGAFSPSGGVSGTVNFTTQSNVQSCPPTAARHCKADRNRHSVSNPLSWSFQQITQKASPVICHLALKKEKVVLRKNKTPNEIAPLDD